MLIISQGLKILHGKIEKMSFDNENQCPPYLSLQKGQQNSIWGCQIQPSLLLLMANCLHLARYHFEPILNTK